jgi:FkbM family methyltransferase
MVFVRPRGSIPFGLSVRSGNDVTIRTCERRTPLVPGSQRELLTMPVYRSKRFIDLVSGSYERPDGPEHRLIKRKAREWIGLDRRSGPAGRRRRFIHRTLKTARHLALDAAESGLGHHPIGSGDLVIECLRTDTNTAAVFLYGFSDNLRFFDYYGRFLKPGQTVIDVGANVGIHTLVMSDLVGPAGRVFSYEPSETVFRRLQKNLEINSKDNVHPRKTAAGSTVGTTGFSDRSHETNIGKSHLDPSSDHRVSVTTLDREHSGAESISLIKIDVEGSEMEVLRGAGDLLRDHRPVIFMEYNARDYTLTEVTDLIPYRYTILGIPHTYYRKEKQISPGTRITGYHNIAIIPA